MFMYGMPFCCTAEVIVDFPYGKVGKMEGSKKEVLAQAADAYKDGNAVLIATLTTRQEAARAMLMEVGFLCSQPMPKRRHKEQDLYVLWLPLAEWAKTHLKQQPRDAKGRFIKLNPFKQEV